MLVSMFLGWFWSISFNIASPYVLFLCVYMCFFGLFVVFFLHHSLKDPTLKPQTKFGIDRYWSALYGYVGQFPSNINVP